MNSKIFSVSVIVTLWVIFDGAKSIESKKCDLRLFQHYEVKECSPIFRSDSTCPERFQCPEKAPAANTDECVFKGRSYKLDEKVDVGNPCRRCTCQNSGAGAEISCITPRCGRRPPASDNCQYVREPGQCCRSTLKCSKDGDAVEKAEEAKKVCTYNGKTYNYGQEIDIEEDPCLVCHCNEQWTGINGKSCRKVNCLLELKRNYINRGCIPIYYENVCCPIEFYCGTPEEGFKNTTVPVVSKEDRESGNFCTFKGSHYGLGQVLDINHSTHCVTCTCSTPPDFTCIQRKCRYPPDYDSEHCERNYVKGQCCPTIECSYVL